MEELAYRRPFNGTVEEAVDRLTSELRSRGFGVLGTIPVHQVLKEKLGKEVDPLVILDVCSPVHAHRALTASRDVALLLPCKLIVSREGGGTQISLQRPTVVLRAFFALPELEQLGAEVEKAMTDAVDAATRQMGSSIRPPPNGGDHPRPEPEGRTRGRR